MDQSSEASHSKDNSNLQSPIKRTFKIRPIKTECDDEIGEKFNSREVYGEEEFEPVS
jgi:hypothetical protein